MDDLPTTFTCPRKDHEVTEARVILWTRGKDPLKRRICSDCWEITASAYRWKERKDFVF